MFQLLFGLAAIGVLHAVLITKLQEGCGGIEEGYQNDVRIKGYELQEEAEQIWIVFSGIPELRGGLGS